MEARSRRLLWGLLAMTGAATAILALDPGPDHQAAAAAFQRQVGGLGLAPAIDPDGCANGFDPRLDGDCGAAVGPLPGGDCLCPRHGGVSGDALPR